MPPDRFIVTDPQGRRIRLTEACYVQHILVEHPDLSDDSEIEAAIRQAEVITQLNPEQLWVNYNAKADSLTIYFTGKPVPSIWSDMDEYAYIGFAQDNQSVVTGLMIEHFSKWLLVSAHVQSRLQPA